MALLMRAATLNELELLPQKQFKLPQPLSPKRVPSDAEDIEETSFIWDWPFATDRIAQGAYTKDKFIVCLPFNKGGTGEKNGTTKKFERIAQSNFSWSLGLSRDAELNSTCFWRLELEVQRSYNSIVLIASRDISRYDVNTKRLKRIRKVYRLPNYYDVSTTTTTMYDWAVIIEVFKKAPSRPTLKRSMTLA
ncbi:hypothetical protein PMAYCL1PPCAC_12694 [Pristionchus mayeri]|uniref:Uncharacterized protein n=1 Tax=Pristionchus mayeri TaxID=1317129 RepID=A0AAN5CG71_9BILA|nr:hypothetical protein PMAYCL1PPCAC_12694 [Pristionchus mayeri]